jgi:tetratricopeptide (TPR) repeat protein
LLATFSRSYWLGWLASLLVLVAYVIRKRGYKFRWFVIGTGMLVVVIAVAMITAYVLRHRSGGSADDPEGGLSLNPELLQNLPERPPSIAQAAKGALPPFWKSAIAVGQRNPWLGSGPGMFKWLYPSVRTLQGQPDYASNEYLNLFADYGLIGCVVIFWLIVAFVLTAIQVLEARAARYSAATPSNRFAFTVGGLAAFAAALVQAALDMNLHAPANAFTLAAIMAVVLTCGVHLRDTDDDAVNRPGEYAAMRLKGANKLVLVAALVVAATLLATRSRHSFPSYLSLRLAEHAKTQMNWSQAEKYYRRAIGFDPRNFEAAGAFGDFYAARATWNAREREELCDKALRWYHRAHTLNPYAGDVLIKTGRLYDVLGKREQASERLTRALEADPNNSSYHAQLGLHYLRWGDREKAAASFRRAHELGGTEPLPELELQRLGKLDS